MKKMKNLQVVSFAFLTVLFTSSCSNDDNPPVNEEELITTVAVTFTGGGQIITLTSRDLDGDGPNSPVITQTGGNFVNGTTYAGTVSFLNELANPAEDITEEVAEEAEDHQVFYQITNNLGTFTYTDLDADGKPIGLTFNFTANNTGTGNLIVTLLHLPNKSANGVAAGDPTNAAGETDASVTFPTIVQ
jgi:hypothetical protein